MIFFFLSQLVSFRSAYGNMKTAVLNMDLGMISSVDMEENHFVYDFKIVVITKSYFSELGGRNLASKRSENPKKYALRFKCVHNSSSVGYMRNINLPPVKHEHTLIEVFLMDLGRNSCTIGCHAIGLTFLMVVMHEHSIRWSSNAVLMALMIQYCANVWVCFSKSGRIFCKLVMLLQLFQRSECSFFQFHVEQYTFTT